jgi:hypothetical protein
MAFLFASGRIFLAKLPSLFGLHLPVRNFEQKGLTKPELKNKFAGARSTQSHFCWGEGMHQFISNSKGNQDTLKDAWKKIHTVDENKIMERASVSSDDSSAHLACDLAKSVQVGGELLIS